MHGHLFTAGARHRSEHTVHNYVNSLTKFSNFLDEDLPIEKITRHHIEAFFTRGCRRDASGQVLDKCMKNTADRNRIIILLLLDTGMRASELCGPNFSHVDTRNRRVLVMGKDGGNSYTLQALLGYFSSDTVKNYLRIAQIDIDSAHRRWIIGVYSLTPQNSIVLH